MSAGGAEVVVAVTEHHPSQRPTGPVRHSPVMTAEVLESWDLGLGSWAVGLSSFLMA